MQNRSRHLGGSEHLFVESSIVQAELEGMHKSLQQAKESQATIARQLQFKQAAVKQLRSFLKAELRTSVRRSGLEV